MQLPLELCTILLKASNVDIVADNARGHDVSVCEDEFLESFKPSCCSATLPPPPPTLPDERPSRYSPTRITVVVSPSGKMRRCKSRRRSNSPSEPQKPCRWESTRATPNPKRTPPATDSIQSAAASSATSLRPMRRRSILTSDVDGLSITSISSSHSATSSTLSSSISGCSLGSCQPPRMPQRVVPTRQVSSESLDSLPPRMPQRRPERDNYELADILDRALRVEQVTV